MQDVLQPSVLLHDLINILRNKLRGEGGCVHHQNRLTFFLAVTYINDDFSARWRFMNCIESHGMQLRFSSELGHGIGYPIANADN